MQTFAFGRPMAVAYMHGGASENDTKKRPNPTDRISGTVSFYPYRSGTLVIANIQGLPLGGGSCASPVFGFHIHEGDACTGESFADTKGI